jgi:hypothetical protein
MAPNLLPKPIIGLLIMARQPSSFAERVQWYTEYKQNEQEWLNWLETNARHYKSLEDAWGVFAAQLQDNSSFINVETAFRRNK